jgi:predicted amidophosphoribosyltransferase
MESEYKLPKKEGHFCPYCDDEIAEASWPYCDACDVTVFYCPDCRKPVPRDKKSCPHCGAEIKGEKT